MPNWCDTVYTVTGEKDKVKKLYDLITRLNKLDQKPGDLWMGHISNELGGTEEDTARGWVYGIDELSPDEDQFTFYCNTAWSEPDQWRHFVEAKAEVSILYIAIEPGCGVYLSNHEDYIDQYVIHDNDNGEEYPYSEQEVINIVNTNYNQHCKTIEDCLAFAEQINEKEGHEFLYINKFADGE